MVGLWHYGASETTIQRFSDGDKRSPHLSSLKKSRETVTTVTGATGVSEGSEGVLYYRKKQSDILEHDQLRLLKKVGLPVPTDVLWSAQTQESATSASGSPLGEVLKANEANKSGLWSKATSYES